MSLDCLPLPHVSLECVSLPRMPLEPWVPLEPGGASRAARVSGAVRAPTAAGASRAARVSGAVCVSRAARASGVCLWSVLCLFLRPLPREASEQDSGQDSDEASYVYYPPRRAEEDNKHTPVRWRGDTILLKISTSTGIHSSLSLPLPQGAWSRI